MSVHFLSADLAKWDESDARALALTVFEDERPLRGAAGLADWRLCGAISNLLRNQHLKGVEDEVVLTPTGRRLPFERIFIFGLGQSSEFSEDKFRKQVVRIRAVLEKANVGGYAVQPPGRATGLIAARRALELWLEVSGDPDENIAIVDSAGAQKEMADVLPRRPS